MVLLLIPKAINIFKAVDTYDKNVNIKQRREKDKVNEGKFNPCLNLDSFPAPSKKQRQA